MVFLDASEKKYQQEEQNKVRLQRMELNRTRKFALTMLFVAVAFLFISVWGFQQRGNAMKKAKEAENSQAEAEFRKKESDSLRTIAEGRASVADMEKMLAQMNADSSNKQTSIAYLKEKEVAEKNAEKAIEQQSVTEKEKNMEFNKRMLSIAQTMSGKVSEVEDANLKGLLAYQAYQFNRDFDGQPDHPDIYNALYNAMAGLNGEKFNGLEGHEGAVRSLAFIPGTNTFFSSGGDGKILRWDLNGNTKSYRTLIDNNFINRSLAISPNGRWLACGTTTSGIQLFNLNVQSSPPTILQGHKGWVEALSFTADNKGLFSASTDKSIIYWDLITGTNTTFITMDNTKVRCLAVSPTSRFLYGGTDNGQLIRWNMDTKEASILFQSDNNSIYSVAINSSGTRIAFVDKNGTLRLADARNNNILRAVPAHSARILDVKFSPDDRQLATSSMDKTVKIWDANNFAIKPIVIDKHEAWVLSVAFSSDGRYLVSCSDVPENRSIDLIYFWQSHASGMADQMCSKLTRNLTQREWETYVSYDIPYQKTCPNK
jgi:WD40 repeat protein